MVPRIQASRAASSSTYSFCFFLRFFAWHCTWCCTLVCALLRKLVSSRTVWTKRTRSSFYVTRIVKERKWHSVIVVTSNFHTRRTRYIFLRVFPQSVEVRVASARDGDFDPEHWWEKRKSIKELTKEFAGMVVAVWELRGKGGTSEKTQSVVEWRGPIPLCMV